jgi:hypothetical protein
MKRFWLFQGERYYPTGGMRDFIDSFDTQEEAISHAKEHAVEKNPKYYGNNWAHVLDTQNMSIKKLIFVAKGEEPNTEDIDNLMEF